MLESGLGKCGRYNVLAWPKFVQMLQENQNELFDQANIWVSAFDKDS